MLLSLMNLDVKIQLTQPGDYVIRQLMVLKIKIGLKKVVSDMGLMELVFKELIVNLQYFSTQKKNNANNFVLTICKYLISRTENPKALKIISEIISSPKLEINNVKIELLEKCMDEKEYKQMFDDEQKIIPKKNSNPNAKNTILTTTKSIK